MTTIVQALLCAMVLFIKPSLTFSHTDPHSNSPDSDVTIPELAFAVAEGQGHHQVGHWGPVDLDWPVLAVHATLLPNGKVLFWDATPDDFDNLEATHQSLNTRVSLWSPPTELNGFGSHVSTENKTGTDLFCAGSAHLWDGRVLFSGGDTGENRTNGPSLHSNIYDYTNNTWSRADDMNTPRWYSTVVAMSNGEMLTVGGTYNPNPYAELFGLDKIWHALAFGGAFGEDTTPDYQWLIVGPNGNAFGLGPYLDIVEIKTENGGQLAAIGKRESYPTAPFYRSYGSYALFDAVEGKSIIAGGGELAPEFKASKSTMMVQLKLDDPNNWYSPVKAINKTVGDMHLGRRQLNLTVLADQSVLATGGHIGGPKLIYKDEVQYANFAEIWNPETEQWTLLSASEKTRQYHSVAILLPDASVMTGGGGYCGDCDQFDYFEDNAEIFYPPYLFENGSENITNDRPIINEIIMPNLQNSDLAVDYKTEFIVKSNQAARINKITLIKLGSVTHSQNQDQRAMALEFKFDNDQLIVTSPVHRHIAPPGHYMLFLLNEKGIPSVSKIIKLGQPLLSVGKKKILDRVKPAKWNFYKVKKDNYNVIKLTYTEYSTDDAPLLDSVQKAKIFVAANGVPSQDNNDCYYEVDENKTQICYAKKEDNQEWQIGIRGNEQTQFHIVAESIQHYDFPVPEPPPTPDPVLPQPDSPPAAAPNLFVTGKKYDQKHKHDSLGFPSASGFQKQVNVYYNSDLCPQEIAEDIYQAIEVWASISNDYLKIQSSGYVNIDEVKSSLFQFDDGIVINCTNNMSVLGRDENLSIGLASAQDSDNDGFFDKGQIVLNNQTSGKFNYFSQQETVRIKVLSHFLGHALGLGHNTDTLSIMNETMLNTSLVLSETDVNNFNSMNGYSAEDQGDGCARSSISASSDGPKGPMSMILLLLPLLLLVVLKKEHPLTSQWGLD